MADTYEEELVNAVLHGVGLGMAVAATGVLIVMANIYGDTRQLTAYSIYGSTLILLYLASTLYHSFPRGKTKYVLRIIDHSAIYLLIAGTYTPITMATLGGALGRAVFISVWAIAVLGIVLNILFFERVKKISLVLYLVMGWLSILVIRDLWTTLPPASLVFLFVGGLSYTIGTIFYVRKNLRYNHAIWHIFVLGGSIFHFFTVFYNLLD
ncbi:MAG: PAQR family membrane homeostasis protein TrhA [Bacillota bacterium]